MYKSANNFLIKMQGVDGQLTEDLQTLKDDLKPFAPAPVSMTQGLPFGPHNLDPAANGRLHLHPSDPAASGAVSGTWCGLSLLDIDGFDTHLKLSKFWHRVGIRAPRDSTFYCKTVPTVKILVVI